MPDEETTTQEETTPTTTPDPGKEPEPGKESEPGKEPEAKPEPTKAEPLTAEALEFPEGLDVPENLSGKFLETANKLGLSKDGANELIGLQAEVMKAASERSSELWQQTQDAWQEAARKDPEVGGEKLDPALADIRKLLDEYGSPELDDVFNLTGAGNNVHMVKFLKKVADLVGVEGKPVPGGQPASAQTDMAHRMFPNMQ